MSVLLFIIAVIAAIAVISYFPSPRQLLLTGPILRWFAKRVPKVSTTEAEALNAGDPWIEKQLFQGNFNWQKFSELKLSTLTDEEQRFLDNETSQLCQMLDDWRITSQDRDLSLEVWNFIKSKNFFGLVIDPKYGGKGFSAAAHSAIVMKIASRSLTAAVTVMVPNSLGPGELLYHYGTDDQKQTYLPKLATGELVPCFALTGVEAGSDASSLPDKGTVCKAEFNGEEVLGIKLNFNKRYITLAPIADLIGLAFKLYDPDHLLSDVTERGITCALLKRDLPGLTIGARHLPLDLPFMNGTIQGKEVFIPLDWVIGGADMIGQGWRMLVECLSIGRSISLPAVSSAYALLATVMTGSYALIREQFRTPIGKFEGVQEHTAKILGSAYIMEATRLLTLTAVDHNCKPSVASAIAKYHLTEMGRSALNSAMDIHGGRAIILGPNNYIGRAYQGMPICITVEGANILTRNLMIFGQGAMVCHPALKTLFFCGSDPQGKDTLSQFEHAIGTQLRYSFMTKLKANFHGITGGRFIALPEHPLAESYRLIQRLSYAYSWISDTGLLLLGGSLKRKERLSARLGDVLSHLYMAVAVIKYFDHRGQQSTDLSLAKWSIQHCLYQAQEALFSCIDNMPFNWLFKIMRRVCFPYGRPVRPNTDKQDAQLADQMIQPNTLFNDWQQQCYIPDDANDPIGKMYVTRQKRFECDSFLNQLKQYVKEGKVSGTLTEQIAQASSQGLMNEAAVQALKEYDALRIAAINVDAFSDIKTGTLQEQ